MNKRVLFIDDDERILAGFRRNLHGVFEVDTAVGPEAGLAKVRDTKAQSSLGRSERHGNVVGAFAAGMDMSGMHVLLVDDVMTTGATMTACAKACLGAGAARVDVFVLARAL